MRLKGATNVQIADALGIWPANVVRSFRRLQERGVEVPPNPYFQRGRVAA